MQIILKKKIKFFVKKKKKSKVKKLYQIILALFDN